MSLKEIFTDFFNLLYLQNPGFRKQIVTVLCLYKTLLTSLSLSRSSYEILPKEAYIYICLE